MSLVSLVTHRLTAANRGLRAVRRIHGDVHRSGRLLRLQLAPRRSHAFPLEKNAKATFEHDAGLLFRLFHTQRDPKRMPRRGSSGKDLGDDDDDDRKRSEDEERQRRIANLKLLLVSVLVPLGLGTWIVLGYRRKAQLRDEWLPGSMNANHPATQQQQRQENLSQTVSWKEFQHEMLLAGEVQRVVIHSGVNRVTVVLRPDAVLKGKRVASNVFRLQLPGGNSPAGARSSLNENTVEDRIREIEATVGIPPGGGVLITYDRQTEVVGRTFSTLVGLAVMAMLFRGLRGRLKGVDPFSMLKKADFTLVEPSATGKKGVRFSDVAGLSEAKVEVMEFVDYLKNPERYEALGAKPPKGALMTGPPGCGKTMLAKAVANEAGVPFLSMNGSEFIEMIGGLGAARVRDLFAQARKRSPSIVYIDEIDAIGRKRSGVGGQQGGGGEAEQTLNQLLVEMDGIISNTEGNVIVLASTNREDVLDRALLRPGRFDRHIPIDLPTLIERKEILEQHMKGVKLAAKAGTFSERLATLTPGFSGADLANLVNESALHAARLKRAKVASEDLEYAVERVIAGPEKKTNVLSPDERKVVAYHESGHALVGWMLEHTDALLKVTILPRTSQALGFAQYTPTDKKLHSPQEMMDMMCMALGGRVAESITFNRITTGAQNDLQKVTKMADSQIRQFGFNDVVGLVSFGEEEEEGGARRPYSKRLHATMELEARLLVAGAYKATEQLLQKNKQKLKLLAEALLEKETLNYDDVEALLGPPPFGKKHLVSPVDFENRLRQQAELGKSKEGSL